MKSRPTPNPATRNRLAPAPMRQEGISHENIEPLRALGQLSPSLGARLTIDGTEVQVWIVDLSSEERAQ